MDQEYGKHAPRFQRSRLVLWPLACGLETACAYCALRASVSVLSHGLLYALLLHCSACVLFFLPSLLAKRVLGDRRTAFDCLAGMMTLFLPVVGLAGSMLALGSSRFLRSRSNKAAEFRDSVEAKLSTDHERFSKKQIGQLLSDEIAIEPIADVLHGKDPELKRGAVKLLARIGTPAAVQQLRGCLSDALPEVRYYAHSALTDMEDEHVHRIRDLTKQLEESQDIAVSRALGLAYRAYAESGLVDDLARGQHLERSREQFTKSFDADPSDVSTALLLGQILLQLGRPDEAASLFSQCAQHEETASAAQLGLAQIALEGGNLARLSALVKDISRSEAPRPTDPDQMLAFDFWREVGSGSHG